MSMRILGALLLLLGTCFGEENTQVQTDKKNNFSFRLDVLSFDLLPDINYDIKNAPEYIRQIPIHKDDGGAGKIRTIPFDSLDPGFLKTFNPLFGPEFTVGKVKFFMGAGFSMPVTPRAMKKNSRSTREISQRNDNSNRGIGTALVFYAFEKNTVWVMPRLNSEIEFKTSRRWRPIIGGSLSRYNTRIQSGWDRYNKLRTYKGYKVSDDRVIDAYGGLRFYSFNPKTGREEVSFFFRFGKAWNKSNFTELGRSILTNNPRQSVFFGFGYSAHIN
ncbi:MAG: hypothetical protein Q8Q06_00515 [bacterium]|nr:hypothetical protein [bacterium]